MDHQCPHDYERKFANFIQMCKGAKSKGIPTVIVQYPWVLGDNYEEIIESLSRLADAGLALMISGRPPSSRNN